MEDRDIVALYWSRNEEAIAQTQRRYGGYLYKIAFQVLADREDSEESVNDTYWKAWGSIPPHRPGVLRTYLGKITRQLSIDRLRGRDREKRRASEYALSLSELDNGNPWREDMALDTLPVYRNGSYSEVGEPVGLSAGEVEQRARAAAQALGVEITSLEQERDGYFTSGVTRVRALGEGVRIEADANGTVTVWFDSDLPLPEEYSFTHSNTSDQEAEAVLDYLIDRYADLLNFRQPQKVLSGDRNIYGEFDRNYHVYDAAGDDVEDLLNYTFRCAQFAPDDHGNLMLIRLRDGLAAAEKIGDYPLITLEEAREALLEGQYLTTVPYDFPGEENVYGGELVYRGSATEQVFIPYYRFYVDLTHEFPNWDNGLKNFGAYYVPAIQHQYLKPGWQWDGSFN